MIRVNQIKCSLDEPITVLPEKIAKKLQIRPEEILEYRIFKESIDARHKEGLHMSYTVDVRTNKEEWFLSKPRKDISKTPDMNYVNPTIGTKARQGEIVIAGFGPAGMFSALLFAQMGYHVHVVERGGDVDERVLKVEAFWNEGTLDETCNVQFGEGGAGTFSDGKLTTRVKDLRARKVLETFVEFGAPESILYEAHPHIGTDQLRQIVKNIRLEIERLGGQVDFHAQLEDIELEGQQVTKVKVNDTWIACDALLLAIGHSARDTFELLHKHHIMMNPKAFAVGVRIEHPQSFVNEAQYKEFANHPRLKAAEYRFVHTCTNGRGVYTFCMCPGGTVVASASQSGGVVVNGMSEYARDQVNANSALMVQVSPSDYGDGVLDGIHFQEALEQAAFSLGKGDFKAPVQRVKDFLDDCPTTALGKVEASYRRGVTFSNLRTLFPPYINDALCEAIHAFDKKMHGFAMDDALMTGVETRSSSPLRMERDPATLASVSIDNLYPCGEGAGYAGGIVSAAIDGMRGAEKIIELFAREQAQ